MKFLKLSGLNVKHMLALSGLLVLLFFQMSSSKVSAGPTNTATSTAYSVGSTGAFLSLVANKTAYAVGEKFTVTARVNSGSYRVDGVDGVINYDKSILSLLSVKKSDSVVFNQSGDDCAINKDFGNGNLTFTCFSGDALNSKVVAGDLVVLTFGAKTGGKSRISFECEKGSVSDSNIVWSNSSMDIIDCSKNNNLLITVKQNNDLNNAVTGKCGDKRNVCISGKPNDEALPDTKNEYRWKCIGANSGKNVNCTLNKKIEGKCGSKRNTCLSGTVSRVSDSSSRYKWKCVGKYGGKTVNCSVRK
ncbi:MAG: cohesin domain-containing protein [Candidatus Shapirobacteria bacterium]|nr:cohesin domain-containing protein [Candidatus Shapirobacteria bacterium]